MRSSNKYIYNPVSCRYLHVQLGFVLLIAAMTPTLAHAITTGPTISNNTFASTAVGGSLTQTVTLTLTSAETIKSIALQPGQPGATEYAIQSISGCKVDNVTQSSVGTVCDVSIKFTPLLPGSTISPTFARTATLVFTDSSANVFDYGLTGAATGPVAKVVPGKVSLYAGVTETGLNALDLGFGLVTGGYGGDGGPATSATFNLTGVTAVNALLTQPLALDSAGNLYVADAGNFIIRKIDNTSAHNVTTIAGTPTVTGTSTGSGGLATSATLAYPHAIVVDAAGNIFFIDAASQYSSYSIVYRIDVATKIITAIGGQLYNPSDGYNTAQGGGTCVPDLGTPGYYECGDGGLAGYASLPNARNLAIDTAGNLYIWESGGYIRKVAASTGIITTFATAADFPSGVVGTPSFALGGMTLASDGNFYVLVVAGPNELIYELNTTTQAVTQVAGGQQPNYTGSCDSSGSVNGNTSAPYINIAEGQAGYPGAQLFLFTNGVVASTGDLSSDASGNIYYSGAQCNGADVYDYRPAVFRINLPTDTAYLETVGGSTGTATYNYDAYTGFNIAPASAIPDGNGNLYFTTNNQIGVISASAGALDFGQQRQFTTGITRIATYENVGNATDTGPTYILETGLDFTDVSTGDASACSLLTQVGVNKTCNIDYEFTPIQPNNITDTINLAEATPGNNPGFGLTTNAQTVTLTGDATPEAQFLVTPSSLSFGNVVVGQSVTKTFTVSNMEGGAALGLYGIYVYPNGVESAPTEYTLGGTCDPAATSFSVAAGSTCTITVTFTPTAVTSYPTTLTINNSVTNPEGAPFTITGAGVPATVTNPVFSSNVGTALAAQEVTVTIATAGTLHAMQVLTGGADNLDFTMASGGTCATSTAYTVGETCTVNVGFKPIFAGARNGAILLTDSSGNILATAYLPGTGVGPQLVFSPGVFTRPLSLSAATPNGVAVDDSGDVYVANYARTGVLKFPPTAGGYGTPVTVATGLSNALQLAVDGGGNVYIADGSTEVIKVPWTGSGYGAQTMISPTGLANAYGVAVDALGNVYIADAGSAENKVLMLTWTGSGYGTPTTIGSGLKQPYAVAVDGGSNVYIADWGNNRVVEVPFTGSGYGTQTTVGSGLSAPQGVAVDANGDVYIADTGNSRVVEVPWTGSSFGTQFNLGNEQPQLGLLNPLSIAVDGSGNFYIVDNHSSDYFLDVVNVSAPPSFNFSPSGETTTIGSTSATSPMPAYVENIGNASLTFTTPSSGENPNYPVNFPINSTATNLCASGTPLTKGASCNVSVNFTPTATGSLTGDVVLTDNDLNVTNSTQSIPVSGTGAGTVTTSTTATLAPNPLMFPSVQVGSYSIGIATLTNTGSSSLTGITISFTGTNAGAFSTYPTSTCGTTLATGDNCTIVIHFTPGTTGNFTATLSVADNATGSPQTIALTGIGTAAPTAQVQFNPVQLNAIAGTGIAAPGCNDTGDGSAALQAKLCTPYAAVEDASGNIYMADQDDNVVKKIDPSGKITTFAGLENTGPGSFSGDNGPATAANLSSPLDVAVDLLGNIYISDYGNGRIRKVDTGGTITTFVGGTNGYFNGGSGTGVALGPGGIAFDLTGNLYIADINQQIVVKITPAGSASLFAGTQTPSGPGTPGYNGDNILATDAELNFPNNVATDQQGNVYIADTNNYRIRMVAAGTGMISTVAGNGTKGDTGDGSAATSAEIGAIGVGTNLAGDLFISDGSTIRKVSIASGNISTYAGGGTGGLGGPATSALLKGVGLVRADNYGDLLIPVAGTPELLLAGPDGILQFGNQMVGTTSAPLTITVENTGNFPLSFTQNTFTASGDFTVTGGTCEDLDSANSGGTCTLTVTFTPSTTGALTGTISMPSNAPGTPQTVLLQGTGTGAAAPTATLAPSMLNFSSITVGTTATAQTLTLSNTSDSVLNITGITIGGANPSDFAQTSTCGETLAANSMCTISVTFTPASATSFAATVTVADNATGATQMATLSGTGITPSAPAVSLSPSSLSYEGTVVGATSVAQTVTLSNTGNATLNITGIVISGTNPSDFAETSTCGETLAVNAMCTISITFTPSSVASFAATVSVTDNAAGSPQMVTLSGTGITAPDFSIAATPATQTVSAGSSTTYNITVGSINGDFNNVVTLSASGLPVGATATFAPAAVTPGSESAGSGLTVQTTSAQAQTHVPHGQRNWPWIPAVTMAFFIPLLWWRRRDRVRLLNIGLLCALLGVGAGMLSGCGGGYYAEPPAQTYTIIVTGISGSIQHSTTVTLTVQ